MPLPRRRPRRPPLVPATPTLDPSGPLAAGLVFAPFLNVSAAPVDLAAPGRRGVVNGTATLAASPGGRALAFDGATGYVTGMVPVGLLDFVPATGSCTFAARFALANHNADAAGGLLAGDGSTATVNVSLWYENRSAVGSPRQVKLAVGVATPGAYGWLLTTAAGAIADDGWHTVVMALNNTSGAAYVDGVPSAGTFSTSGVAASPLAILPDLGRFSADYLYLGGQVEHVLAWDRPLSAAEAMAYHAEVIAGYPTLLRWPAPPALAPSLSARYDPTGGLLSDRIDGGLLR